MKKSLIFSLVFLLFFVTFAVPTRAQAIEPGLQFGSQGNAVVLLQQILKDEGFFMYPVATGFFGNVTKQAVVAFQDAYANIILTPLNLTHGTGYVGSLTAAALNAANPKSGFISLTLTASPTNIAPGQGTTLSWTTTNASSCSASGGWSGSENPNGTLSVTPALSTTYTLTCSSGKKSMSQSVLVTVTSTPPPPAAPTVSLSASPTSITSGGSSTLTWSSTNANSCTSTDFITANGTSGSLSVSPTTSTTYAITCTGTGGSATGSATVTVNSQSTPTPTVSLSASPTSITSGQSSTLTWGSTNATSCTTSGFSGSGTSGSATVSPTTSTTYSVTCTGAGGSATGSATISVNAATPAPTVSLSASPTSITSGGSSTLTWSSTNASSCTTTGFSGSGTSGSTSVSPTTSTTYSITCTGAGGNATGSATVTVSSSSTPPILNFSSLNCPSAPSSFSTAFYVNPTASSVGQNGSQSNPWTSLATVLATEVGGSGPVQPGDVIYLESGNYGDVTITNVNSGFIGLEAAPGQTPILHTLTVNGASHWYIHGLKIQTGPEAAPYAWIVHINPNGQSLPVTDIILDGNTINTVDSSQGWTTTQWQNQMANGLDMNMGEYSGSGCVEVTNNAISNVDAGIFFGIDNSLFSGNTLNDFGDDALDYTGYNNQFMTNNTFTNSNYIGDSNHNDAFQGFTGYGAPVEAHSNVLISGNTVIRQTGPTGSPGVTAFPGNLQGIDVFDTLGIVWNNVQVLDNTIITSSYWGVGLLDTDSGIVANNTILDDGTNISGNDGQIWIAVGDANCGVTSTPAVSVENNIVPYLFQEEPSAKFTHNLVPSNNNTANCVNGAQVFDNNAEPNWSNNTADPNLLSYLPGFKPTSYEFNVTPTPGTPAANYGVTAPTTLVSESTTLNRSTLLASVGAGIAELIQTLNHLLHS